MIVHTYYAYKPMSFRSLVELLIYQVRNEDVLVKRYIADMAYILVRSKGLKAHEVKRFNTVLDDLYHFKREDMRTGEEIIDHLLQKGGT